MKKAFTMIELVFVIVVIGILSAAIIPRTESNSLREAAMQVVSHIRYTQHLAMLDDKFDISDPHWYKKRWQLRFGSSVNTNNKISYAIYTDVINHDGNPNLNELALDPIDSNKYLCGGWSGILQTTDARANKKMNIGESYGIEDVIFTGGCASNTVKRLTFDHLGRSLRGTTHSLIRPYEANKIIQDTCEITLCTANCTTATEDEKVIIEIEPETGYVHIQQE